MDITKIAARVAAEPVEPAESDIAVAVEFSLHGQVSVNVRVDPSWLDEDGDLLPEHKVNVQKLGKEKAYEMLQGIPDNVQWQLEEM
jgi:hypothetical protein